MPDKYVIITAGGVGTRMGSPVPKQFMDLKGLPVIMHSIQAFLNYSKSIRLVLVLPENSIVDWKSIYKKNEYSFDHELCVGGNTRFQSVKNGLSLVGDNGLVAIHDGVRPLVSHSLIQRCFEEAAQSGNAVPAIQLKDSVRELSDKGSQAAVRDNLRLIQTPQIFETMQIKKAYEQKYHPLFTDDATVAESIGIKINLIEGEASNIKVTTQEDLLIAKALIQH